MSLPLRDLFREAANKEKVVRIAYTDKNDNQSTRNVEPYEISDGNLFAYCRKKKGLRQFALDRIHQAKVTHYPYLPKWPVKLQDDLNKQASFNPWVWRIADTFGRYEDAFLE